MHKFILFEGLDRTGKSTIAEKIAKLLDAKLLHSPPEVLVPFRKYFDTLDNTTNFSYYLTANQILDFKISEYLKKQNVVCDRYYPTTAAYHSAKLNKNMNFILDTVRTKPDRIYYLTANPEILDKRATDTNSVNDRFHGIDLWRKVSKNYDKIFLHNPSVLRIDTTNKTEKEVLQIVLDDLKTKYKYAF